MLRALTYAANCMVIGAFYRRPSWAIVVFTIAHAIFSTVTDITVHDPYDYFVFTPLVSFLFAIIGWLFDYCYRIREVTAHQEVDNKIYDWTWTTLFISLAMFVISAIPWFFYDFDLWEGQWFSYLTTLISLFAVYWITWAISLYGMPFNSVNLNSRKMHIFLYVVNSLMTTMDWIFYATINPWQFWVPFGFAAGLFAFLLIVHFTQIVRPPTKILYDTLVWQREADEKVEMIMPARPTNE